jgi:hypothetical protein
MRALILFVCAIASAIALAASAYAAEPDNGELSLERGRGTVQLEIRGVVLGRLTSGTLRVTDLTPRDRFTPAVVGRKLTSDRLGPRTVLYRGQGLRFRMLGGRYRIVIRGAGMSVSAVGRGTVSLDGDPRTIADDVGVFSLDGVDCGMAPDLCLPLPVEPEQFPLGGPPDDDGARRAPR